MLLKHRGEVEFDFRSILHTSLLTVAKDDGEIWRLLRILLNRSDSQVFAAVAGWDQPLSVEVFMLASIYSAWTGQRHQLLPDVSDRSLSDVETRLADMALEAMNRR